jgi:threonine synthase
MKYISTRGRAPKLSFAEVLFAGLASDGGLYVPETIPTLSKAEIEALRGLSYPELAAKIMLPFVDGFLDENGLLAATTKAYAGFADAKIAPVKKLEDNHYVLELFHGPTLAFKDFALQLLGHLLDVAFAKSPQKAVVLGATSGDTGSAALAGVRGRTNIESFILFPNGRVSDVQRRQMTTIADENVHCLAVEGTFDDCQNIVKTMFADGEFRAQVPLIAVNSINWARVLAQVVYYFYASFQVPKGTPRFCVPTGNFGDIYAGYVAKQMGLPIETLIIASNANDILTRCLNTGVYGMTGVVPTLSPSMDIQISSNFERLLFDLYGRDGASISALMDSFKTTQSLTLPPVAHAQFKALFAAHACDDAATLATMQDVYANTGELLDPHTAVGVYAARKELAKHALPIITFATAHPAKFPDAVVKATGKHPALPAHLKDLFERNERYEVIPASVDAVKAKIAKI